MISTSITATRGRPWARGSSRSEAAPSRQFVLVVHRAVPLRRGHRLKVVAMDMHEPYIKAVAEALPDGENKAFRKFHVAMHLGDAVNKVRREEHAVRQTGFVPALLAKSVFCAQAPASRNPEEPDDHQGLARAATRTSAFGGSTRRASRPPQRRVDFTAENSEHT